MKKLAAALLFLAFLLPSGAQAKDYSEKIAVNGDSREFLIHVPDALAGQKNLPVVLVFHGGGGNAEGMRTQTGMDGVADRNGFVAVYPQGSSGLIMRKARTWNAGRCCGYAARKKIDDVAFVSQMIDFLVARYSADPRRIYATGHSNGAQLSYLLSCRLAGKIAAIAPNAGQPEFDSCTPSRPVPVLHMHGTKDPCALYDGGDKCGGCYSHVLGFDTPGDQWPCPAVRDVVRERAKMNGCADITDIVFQKGAVTCEAFEDCPKGAQVELCSIEGAGHMWAGAHDRGPAACHDDPDKKICKIYRETVGPQNTDIDAGEMAWSFFKDIRLPEAEKR